MNQEVEFYVKLRDTGQTLVDIAKQRIELLTPLEVKEDTETVFTELNYEREEGPKLGIFEAAYKADNPEDKWTQAYNILKNSKATIKDRYHGEGYRHSYWLFGEDKIFRQKIKPKK